MRRDEDGFVLVGSEDFGEQRQRIEAKKFLRAIHRPSNSNASAMQVMVLFLQLVGGGATEDDQRTEGQPSSTVEEVQITALGFLIATLLGACMVFSETPRVVRFRNLIYTLVQWFSVFNPV